MKYSAMSVLSAVKKALPKKTCVYTIFIVSVCLSCSYGVSFSKTLPEKIKYEKVEFETCADGESDYVCIKNDDATKLVINLKQCQEQNNLLRKINGN